MWILTIIATTLGIAISPLEAAYTLKNGRLVNTADLPVFSAERHYYLGMQAVDCNDPREASYHFNVIVKNFPQASFYHESLYRLGVADFDMGEYDSANEVFNEYLSTQSSPLYFESVIAYKLEIANAFRCGAKKRCFGTKMLPKWASGSELASEIYDEVVVAAPCHEYASLALWGKAQLLWEDFDFKGAIECYQQIIRRFPKGELAPSSYLCIGEVYLGQAYFEPQNPDLLALAQINLKKFENDFPKEERLVEARDNVLAIKELYAHGLFSTGQFYERKGYPEASVLYYRRAITLFPETTYAHCSEVRLSILTGCEG